MIRPLQTSYGGRRYRSRVEARWALFLDACGIPFEYEHEGYALPSGPYLPDFWLPNMALHLEIKGQEPTPAERRKCAELAAASQAPVMLAIGAPKPQFQILWFTDDIEWADETDELHVIARDRHSAAGFWLLAEDGRRWMGGGSVTGPTYGPMLTGAIDEAYGAAMSAEFGNGRWKSRHPIILETDPERSAA